MTQMIAAFVGSIGFAIVLRIKGRQIIYAGIGGFITWGIYLLAYGEFESYFLANFIAAVFVAVYAEIMARVNKAPSTIFLTAAAVPLIPGGNLYYTLFGLLSENEEMTVTNGTTAAVVAVAISLGFVFVAVINKYVSKVQKVKK